MTVEEYITSSRWIKLSYRLLRNPFILFGLAPLFLFFVLERIPSSKCKPRERRSVYLMNFTLLLYGTAMSMIFGLVPFLVLQTVMMGVAGGCGIWLFYVQHQFEDTYWAQGKDWDFTAAAMEGSSYFLREKSSSVYFVNEAESVSSAISLMNRAKIGSVMVLHNHQYTGIFTERDVLTRVCLLYTSDAADE